MCALQAYRTWLGFYKGSMKLCRWNAEQLVQAANRYAASLGELLTNCPASQGGCIFWLTPRLRGWSNQRRMTSYVILEMRQAVMQMWHAYHLLGLIGVSSLVCLQGVMACQPLRRRLWARWGSKASPA